MRETLYFCTLFDSGYMSRGLAMYRSLSTVCDNFHLYIFAFDDDAFDLLCKLALPHATIISLSEFEDDKLLAVKPFRSRAEYCWTCTPSIVIYALERFGLSHCTYLDADIYFFSDPRVLIDEIPASKSVLITEHRYTSRYDKSKTSGKYCVQFVYFKNDEEGMRVLRWWRNSCLDACEYNPSKGLNGDQKYLDDWTTRFDGVHELAHLGGGVAPWNVNSYKIFRKDGKLYGLTKNNEQFEIVFYHFHGLKHLKNGKAISIGYHMDKSVQDIYREYLFELDQIKIQLGDKAKRDPHGAGPEKKPVELGFVGFLKSFRHLLQGNKYTFSYGEIDG